MELLLAVIGLTLMIIGVLTLDLLLIGIGVALICALVLF